MSSPWILVLSWALLLWADGSRATEPPKVVYRGDSRHPDVIKFERGFLPIHNPAPVDRYGLYVHLLGKRGVYGSALSHYVSTSRSFEIAHKFALGRAETDETFIYRVKATPHMFEVDGSLTAGHNTPEIRALSEQLQEYSALGGILWEQVLGWTRVPVGPHASSSPAIDEYLANPDKDFVPNKDYNTAFDKYQASGPQPQLDQASTMPRRGQTAYDHAKEFMSKPGIGDVVGWTGDFPLLKHPHHEQRLAAAYKATDDARKAALDAIAACDEADAAARAAAEARNFDVAQEQAKLASDAARRCVDLALRVAQLSREHAIIKLSRYDEAKDAADWARLAASKAAKAVCVKTAQLYEKQGQVDAGDETSTTKELRDKTSSKLAESSKVLHSIAQAVHNEEQWRTASGFQQQAPVSHAMQGTVFQSPTFVWAENREDYLTALEREMDVVEQEVRDLEEGLGALPKDLKASQPASPGQTEGPAAGKDKGSIPEAESQLTGQPTAETAGDVGLADVLVELSPHKPFADLYHAVRSDKPVSAGAWMMLCGAALLEIASWTPVGLPAKALKGGKVATKAIEVLVASLRAGMHTLERADKSRAIAKLVPKAIKQAEKKLEALRISLPDAPGQSASVGHVVKTAKKVEVPRERQAVGDDAVSSREWAELFRRLDEIVVPTDPVRPVMRRAAKRVKATRTRVAELGRRDAARQAAGETVPVARDSAAVASVLKEAAEAKERNETISLDLSMRLAVMAVENLSQEERVRDYLDGDSRLSLLSDADYYGALVEELGEERFVDAAPI